MENDTPRRMPNVPPFVKFVCANVPMVFDDSLSYYEALCALWKYVQGMTDVINNNATLEEEYIEKFGDLSEDFDNLKLWVETYFDNLDVQEEINNKLDEMAESGELERIITEYYQGYINVIFPVYGADGEDTLGDCSIIKNGEESLMIDTFTDIIDETYDSIRDALHNAGISTLTYLVITHYHGDHIGNVLNLLSDGYLTGCTVYLPRATTIDGTTWDGADIKTALTAAGVTWIEINNQTFTVGGDCSVKMLNGSAEDYQYYDDLETGSGNNAYNDRSIVCDIEYRGRHLLFTGDLEYRGCEYIAPQLSVSNYDLLKDMHHGLIDNAPDFCAKVNPDYVLIPASAGMVNKNYSDWLINSVYWVRKSKNVMIQGYQSKEINLTVDILGIHPNKEVNFVNDLDCRGTTIYYVDYDTADEVRTGSEEHPFKTLVEAVIFLQKNTTNEIRINVKSLGLTQRSLYIEGFKNLNINFLNNVVYKNLITIDNCTRVVLSKLKQNNNKLAINHSNVTLQNYENTSGGNAINIVYSRINFEQGLTLSINTDNAVIARYNSEVVIDTSSGNLALNYAENTNKHFLSGYYAKFSFGDNAITYLKTLGFNTKIMAVGDLQKCELSRNASELRALYKNDTGTYSGADMKESLDGYHTLTVDYVDKDGYRRTVRCSKWGNHSLDTIVPRGNNSETYIRSAILSFSGASFTLTSNNETVVRSNDATGITAGNYIRVVGIYGEGGTI